jgi:DNA replication protein DnaC
MTATPSASDESLNNLLKKIDGMLTTGSKPSVDVARPETIPSPPASTASSAPGNRPAYNIGDLTGQRDEPFIPRLPSSLAEAGLSDSLVEELIMRYLLSRGEASGRSIAAQVRLPFLMIEPILNRLKYEQMTAYRGSNSVNDYIHVLSDQGRERARQYNNRTTYFGAAPVRLEDYCQAVKLQSVETQRPRREELLQAFKDLLVDKKMLSKLGPAVNSGRGMFLYGYPGNGKTSIAERITLAFGKYIWIPRALSIEGEIMRLYDPLTHEPAPMTRRDGYLNESGIDERWIRIRRPTIIAGGELTMEMLEVRRDKETNINEAPLQLKSNCGVLVIDDFGRQRMRVDELLNRWIVPLEKRYDFLNMSSGKKTQVPFDQLVIFSTNLQPKDLVDDAFLRRIPYKIEVENPSEAAFRKLFEIMCHKIGIPYRPPVIDYLIERHYKPINRPFRNCHPRDLLLQVKNYCLYHDCPMDLKDEYMDFACENYFSIM